MEDLEKDELLAIDELLDDPLLLERAARILARRRGQAGGFAAAGAGARAAWARATPEQRAARLAKMVEGRRKKLRLAGETASFSLDNA